jgi:hypothetical protein
MDPLLPLKMPCPYFRFWPLYVTQLCYLNLFQCLKSYWNSSGAIASVTGWFSQSRITFNCKLIYEQVDTCKDRIAAALETLRPTSSWDRGAASGQEADTVLLGGRGFGTAMSSVIDYLSSEYGSTFALGKLTHPFL